MVKMFRRLRDGMIGCVEMDAFHTILYKANHVTRRAELMKLFSNAYLWYDFWSQPQPSMATDKSRVLELQRGLNLVRRRLRISVRRRWMC